MSPIERRLFSASYDLTTKIVSGLVVAVLAVLAIAAPVFVAAIFGVLLLVAYAYSARGYEVADGCIVVKRLIRDLRIPLDGVRQASAAGADDFRGCIRLAGSGGLFGYYGLFRTSKLGKSSWYLTNRKHAVVIFTVSKTFLLSPDDADGFLAAVRESTPISLTAPGAPFPDVVQSGGGAAWIAWMIGGIAGCAAISAVAFGVLYSPGPPSCTLTPEALTIHDRFYPVTIQRAAVNLADVRIVDFNVDKEWWPTARTNGFGNSHYHSGWFSLANGKEVRLYRADSMRLVLLPPNGHGNAVLLEATDPEKFMDDLRAAWSNRL